MSGLPSYLARCPECDVLGGAHAAGCSLAPYDGPVPVAGPAPEADPYRDLLTEIRDHLGALRRMAAFALVLLVLWMLVWAVLNG